MLLFLLLVVDLHEVEASVADITQNLARQLLLLLLLRNCSCSFHRHEDRIGDGRQRVLADGRHSRWMAIAEWDREWSRFGDRSSVEFDRGGGGAPKGRYAGMFRYFSKYSLKNRVFSQRSLESGLAKHFHTNRRSTGSARGRKLIK